MCIRDRFEADKTVRKVGDTLASGIHGKIHEVEQENTAVEAAHKTEIAAETAARQDVYKRQVEVLYADDTPGVYKISMVRMSTTD